MLARSITIYGPSGMTGLGQNGTDPTQPVSYDFTSAGPFTNLSSSFGQMVGSWGIGEWAVVLIGGYMLMATVFTTHRAVRKVGEVKRRSKSRRIARAEAALRYERT